MTVDTSHRTRTNRPWEKESRMRPQIEPYRFTLAEAAYYLSISEKEMRRLTVEDQVIPYKKPSRRIYIKRADLDAYHNNLPEA